jgi:hypothetical protein
VLLLLLLLVVLLLLLLVADAVSVVLVVPVRLARLCASGLISRTTGTAALAVVGDMPILLLLPPVIIVLPALVLSSLDGCLALVVCYYL